MMGPVVRTAALCFLVATVAFRSGTCRRPAVLRPAYRLSFGVSPDVPDSADSRVRRASGRGAAEDESACDTVTGVPDAVRDSLSLDSFYAKYTHAYGVPVLSSNQTLDTALTRACYLVRFMLADRPDVRDAMHDGYGRVGLISLRETTTDIPEHSHLDDYWDERARGLGGTPSIPVTTCGEENVLCLNAYDRWYEEDVLLHEFAHAVHLIAMSAVNDTFNGRLVEAWQLAKEEGLWENTYAIFNAREYWAEGVQSFFDAQTCPEVATPLHNTVCTRALLRDYDPRLYGLIVEVFPCMNTLVDRCDNQVKVTTETMRMNCGTEAEAMTTAPTTTATPVGSSTGSGAGTTGPPGTADTTGPLTTIEGSITSSVSPGIGGACRTCFHLSTSTLILFAIVVTLAK